MRLRPLPLFLLLVSCATSSLPAGRTAPTAPGPVAATSAPTELSAKTRARDAELEAKATPFVRAFGNAAPWLTRSGAVVFTSMRDGVPQLYVGDATKPGAAPRKLPTPAERVRFVRMLPDERTLLFASDVGGDRQFHLFKVDVDGTGLVDLTPGEKLARESPCVARRRSDVVAYSAHAMDSEATRVFVQKVDGSPPREVHRDERGGATLDFAPDGSRILFARFNADEDVVIFEIDAVRGGTKRIFPPEAGPPMRASAVYSADAARILVTAQAEGRSAELLAIDRATGATEARYEETTLPNGTIDDVIVSPTGDRLAIVVDGGDHSELRLLDARTLALVGTVATPLGEVDATAFRADGEQLGITLSRAEAPEDVFAVDVRTRAITPLRDDARPGLEAIPPMRTSIEHVTSFDGLVIPTNVYLPARATGRLPTIVRIHGGPSGSAEVKWSPEVRFFSALGYAVVEPNIRGSTGFGVAYQKADDREKRADAVRDVEAIHAWARSQPWCDPDRLVIMGQSYGGYMTLLALTRQPTLWRAGIDLSGMSDLRTMERLEDQAIRVYDETEFGKLGRDDAVLAEWSPLKDVDRIVAPVFVYQGVHDPVTPQNEADQIVKALRRRGVPVEYMLVGDEGHGIVRSKNRRAFLARSARFLEDHAGPR